MTKRQNGVGDSLSSMIILAYRVVVDAKLFEDAYLHEHMAANILKQMQVHEISGFVSMFGYVGCTN